MLVGTAYSWGMGSNNQLGVGSDEDQNEPVLLTGVQVRDKEVIKISSGGQHTLFIAAEPASTSTKKNKWFYSTKNNFSTAKSVNFF